MKTILFVDNSTRCFYIFRLPVAKAFLQLGFNVYVMSPAPYDYFVDTIEELGIKHIPYTISSKLSPIKDFALFLSFYKQYKIISPDIIVHYTIKPNIYGSIAADIRRIPSISIIPGTGSLFKKNGLLAKLVIFLYKVAFRHTKKVWVLNKEDYNSLQEKNIVNKNRLEILPGEGINTTFFNSSKEYKKHHPFIFLYLGRMLREKGVEIIVQASRILHKNGICSFEVHLLGLVDGLSKDVISIDEIHEWEKEGTIRYLGSSNDVRKNIEDSDCIILPSFYGEGVPRSLMEGCSMKRIALTTDNVGCRDVVVDNYNGILCKPKNAEDLADKMKLIMSFSEEKLKEMGENGRQKIEKQFKEEIIVQRYINEITKLIY